MSTIELTHFLTNQFCELCHHEFYEGNSAYTLKETNNTLLTTYFCEITCIDYCILNYPFLEQYTPIQTKVSSDIYYYTNMLRFMTSNIYYPKIIIYDCSSNNLKILQYIHNIQNKNEQTDWEKKFIHNCLKYNLLKIEKII